MFMLKFKQYSSQYLGARAGATAIEYALIGGLISVAIILGVGYFSDQTNSMYSKIASAISSADNAN